METARRKINNTESARYLRIVEPEYYPNEETMQAIEDIENGVGLSPVYDTVEDLMKALTSDVENPARQ